MSDSNKAKESKCNQEFETLFEAANHDPELKKRLLENPKAVAKEWNVALSDQEVEQLIKLNAVVELASDIKFGKLYPVPGPIYYPVNVWRIKELLQIIESVLPATQINPATPVYRNAQSDAPTETVGTYEIAKIPPGFIYYPPQFLNFAEKILSAKLFGRLKSIK